MLERPSIYGITYMLAQRVSQHKHCGKSVTRCFCISSGPIPKFASNQRRLLLSYTRAKVVVAPQPTVARWLATLGTLKRVPDSSTQIYSSTQICGLA
ncbi:hypothetical protein L873DRAFT_1097420 [Choiromyces venosus 120613-1]|uniref:Uncharacterized protein n=1 Tax=Choiromyces venosus 120613-1 TaxID=1336337 RepID=A0A3N4JKW0_9PEZI|nr:hypothetical protein L873DRAFT_1097420 [Choiromyces venosus 120613-1]